MCFHTDEEVILPAVYEVSFSIDYAEGGGSMVWQYPEPRAVTLISSQPVPYNLPKQLDVRYIDETMMVCVVFFSFEIVFVSQFSFEIIRVSTQP